MGQWMPDITKEPTLEQKIEFGRQAGGIHLYWADAVVNDPYYSQLRNPDGSLVLGTPEFHDECAILHGETADELEAIKPSEEEYLKEIVRLKNLVDELTTEKEGRSGCLFPFGRSKK